ncbi:class I adenylate-forming enzyme family protein [Ramlibacter sp. PS4R-6]|uniref:class I adenylate-forming enzyme family protein n=1 Tax=Ramlibacter sp. PS4R-6 TaxID=3133438 RepID=UPI0030A25A72
MLELRPADPNAPALTHEQLTLSHGELARRVDAAAAQLWHGWGVRPGERVAWLAAADPAQIVLLFALARIGAILLPLNVRLAAPEWDAQLAQCAPRLLLHDAAFADAARDLAQRHGIAHHAAQELPHEAQQAAPDHAHADAPVLLVFTSGTTGTPKAAVHTQGNLVANMRIAAQAQGITRDDVVATMLPLFHVGGLCIQTLPALASGAHVALLPRFAPDAAFDAFERHRPTLTLQVPATMKALIDHPRWPNADLSSLRAVWAGSSVVPRALIDAFAARGLRVHDVYGSTETGPFSIADGHPVKGVEAKLADVQGDAGEVLVRGPNVVAHYWPAQPACDAEGWFHTGDLARCDAQGRFAIVGRAKDLVISGGENIHPAEIEAALALHEAVAECAAFGLPDAQWGEVVGVAVVLRPGAAAGEDELRAHLEGRIARFKLPRRWWFVETLPKTALGKVQRNALRALAG